MRKHRNARISVGHLNRSGVYIPKLYVMNPKKTAVILNGKEVELKDWLVSISQSGSDHTNANIEVRDYSDIGFKIKSILAVCMQALESLDNGSSLADTSDLCNVLQIAYDLIPHSELELLTYIQQAISTGASE